MTQLHITLTVSPEFRDDPDLFHQLAQAKHSQEEIALVVRGFTYDVGLQLVQVERTDGPPTPVDLIADYGPGYRMPGHSHSVSEACYPESCTGHPEWDKIRGGR